MRQLILASALLAGCSGVASAEPFGEVTVGIPVPSLAEAEAWYGQLLGGGAEKFEPAPGVVEFKATPNVWLQIFEVENHQPTGAVVRFLVEDMAVAQAARAEAGIDTGEAIEVPGIVTYSEFADPFGNALGFYALP
ncbi:VOC family protein [Cucumibacter marinus]|uniref:VOC family protein n=1 Tax=Cucumibacter marinus TaxID=1121252 RepID=UPI000428BFF6|nr:VOC family protein [Cucumibacter marinus]